METHKICLMTVHLQVISEVTLSVTYCIYIWMILHWHLAPTSVGNVFLFETWSSIIFAKFKKWARCIPSVKEHSKQCNERNGQDYKLNITNGSKNLPSPALANVCRLQKGKNPSSSLWSFSIFYSSFQKMSNFKTIQLKWTVFLILKNILNIRMFHNFHRCGTVYLKTHYCTLKIHNFYFSSNCTFL